MSKILVIGDAILDRYMYGMCPRLSPEAPVPIMRVTGQIDQAGGACNVALNAHSLGIDTSLISAVGQDQAGKDLVDALKSQLSHFHLQQIRTQTTVKTRYISGSHHLLRLDDEETCKAEDLDDVLKYYTEYVKDASWVIFSDYGKHFQSVADAIIGIANAAKVPIAVDPKCPFWDLYRGADLIVPNANEYHEATLRSDNASPLDLLDRYKIKGMVITEGSRGMTYWTQKRKKPIHRAAVAQEVMDPCGAGDTAMAALIVGKMRGLKMEDCLDYANAAAGYVCQRMGTHVVSKMDVSLPVVKGMIVERKVA